MRRCRRVDVGKEKVDGVEATGICDAMSGDAVSCGGRHDRRLRHLHVTDEFCLCLCYIALLPDWAVSSTTAQNHLVSSYERRFCSETFSLELLPTGTGKWLTTTSNCYSKPNVD